MRDGLPSHDAIAGCLQRHGTVLRSLVPPSRALLNAFLARGTTPAPCRRSPSDVPEPSRQIVGIGVEGQGQRRPSKFQIHAKREHRSKQNAASCRVEDHKHAPSQRQGQKFCCLEREINVSSIRPSDSPESAFENAPRCYIHFRRGSGGKSRASPDRSPIRSKAWKNLRRVRVFSHR